MNEAAAQGLFDATLIAENAIQQALSQKIAALYERVAELEATIKERDERLAQQEKEFFGDNSLHE